MSKRYHMNPKKAHAISNGVFLIGLAMLILTEMWWPGILLAIWATLFSRQYLSGKTYTAFITTLIFAGLFLVFSLQYDFNVIAPVILITSGIIIIAKEYYFTKVTVEEEIEEDTDVEEL